MSDVRASLDSGARLAIITAMAALAIAAVFALTHERIAEQERQAELRSITEVLPADYDNDPTEDVRRVTAPAALGTSEPQPIYQARRNGQPIAVAIRTVAPNGYNGPIELLVGIHRDGTVSGVRVISHRETPGLGDGIELAVSDWIRLFTGRSLDDPQPSGWTVARNGGVFPQFTGATITPRAVVQAVQRTLVYFEENRDRLLTGPSDPAPADGTQ